MTGARPPGAPLSTPRALLLDFGGVVVRTTARPEWFGELATEVAGLLESAGAPLPRDLVEADLRAADRANTAWKSTMSRVWAPKELTAEQFWADFVGCDWPAAARTVVADHAEHLCYSMGARQSAREVGPGIPGLLARAAESAIPVAIVSNALSGAVHRDFLAAAGLTEAFAVQVYSDEIGVRKPNPAIVTAATGALGIPPADCWYVGDTPDRDVLVARRAGAGIVILLTDEAARWETIRQRPDVTVAGAGEVIALLDAGCVPGVDTK